MKIFDESSNILGGMYSTSFNHSSTEIPRCGSNQSHTEPLQESPFINFLETLQSKKVRKHKEGETKEIQNDFNKFNKLYIIQGDLLITGRPLTLIYNGTDLTCNIETGVRRKLFTKLGYVPY